MKEEILRMLMESGGYVSGQVICSKLNVSRAAIWKHIRTLRSEGYEILAVNNKGYCLVREPDALLKDAILSHLHTKIIGRNMECFDVVDSTNNYCKRVAEEKPVHGFLAVADRQSAGRGRRGRVWETPSGSSIAMSYLLKPCLTPQECSMITIIAAMAVADGIKAASGLRAGIKWPNDVVFNGKKLCGILTELSMEMTAVNYAVLGIGINVNNKEFPDDIAATATSIYKETGKTVNRNIVAACVTDSFEDYYDRFVESRDLSFLTDDYNSSMVIRGQRVRIISGDGIVLEEGAAEGIDEAGRLLLLKDDGSCVHINAGEISVRGMNGYV